MTPADGHVMTPQGLGPVVMDLSGLRRRREDPRLGRLIEGFVVAMEESRPDLVGRYLLAPDDPYGRALDPVIGDKAAFAGSAGCIPPAARAFHSMCALDLERPLGDIWPPEVEHYGLAFTAMVADVVPPPASAEVVDGRLRLRLRSRWEAFRQADALLATSEAVASQLVELAGVEPSIITVVGDGAPWAAAVERAAGVFDSLAAGRRRPWRRVRKLAFVSPLPPIASGVADYSAGLLEALAPAAASEAPGISIDCFGDGLNRVPAGFPPLEPTVTDARRFAESDARRGGYERVVYVLGNSEYHGRALAALWHRRGIVIVHDVNLTGLLKYSSEVPGAVPGGLAGASLGNGDELPAPFDTTAARGDEPLVEPGRFLREIVGRAELLLVTSEAARRLAAAQVGPDLALRLRVMPFAMALDRDELEAVDAARGSGEGPLVATFGIVDPSKMPEVLLQAVAMIAEEPKLRVAFVGPISASLASELAGRAAALGLGERVEVVGQVERSVYLDHLGRATVAVQLRRGFGGEASAAVGDCLAAGVATVVSDLGWMAELPEDCVLRVDSACPAAAVHLAEALRALLRDGRRRAELSRRAAEYAAGQTFARSAEAVVDALGLSALTPASP